MLDHIIIAKTGYVSIRRVLNYLTEENIDYKKEKITQKQLQHIIRKYKIVNKY